MKTASMFTGGGLFDIGAIRAGYTPVWGIEYDEKIAAVARLNGLPVMTADVCKVDYSTLQKPNHLHASPPCPNFSVAKNGGKETPQDIALAHAVSIALLTLNPDTFTLENVPAYIRSESFKIIAHTLSDMGYWWDVNNLNSADFGVPQTRLRLWVRASRQLLRGYPPPVKWNGWYEAIEDLIPSLPDTAFAPWQMARLPEEYKSFIIGQGTYSPVLEPHRPAQTVTANNNQSAIKAFVLPSGNSGARTFSIREGSEPHQTLTANSSFSKAFLIGGGNNNFADAYPGNGVRYEKEPSTTVTSEISLTRFRAFVLNGTTNSNGKDVTVRDFDQPIFTQKATGNKSPARAFTNGRTVKMTVQALGRFQTVPDWYKGLTVKINGNGVPCLMAQRILETLVSIS